MDKIEKDVNTLANIEKFDWNKPDFAFGTLFYNLANETMEFCTTALKANTFDRGDYKYLCQLVAFYLGADLLNIRFLQPGAHHEARFMADPLYLLAMQMTKNYNKQLSINEIKMIQDATDYIVIFHCLFFLKSQHNGSTGSIQ